VRQNQFQVSVERILRLSDIRMQLETFVGSRFESCWGSLQHPNQFLAGVRCSPRIPSDTLLPTSMGWGCHW